MHGRSKWQVYAGMAAASAVAAYLSAAWLVRETEPARPAAVNEDAPLEKRFPEQAEAWRRPASEDTRWRETRGHSFSLKEREETERDDDPRWKRLFAGMEKLRPQPAGCLECHASSAGQRQSAGCLDCHEQRTLALRITRSGFSAALHAAGRPTHPQMRSFVCGQCHSEYFFAGPDRTVTRPWANGLKAEQIEAWYDQAGVSEWVHAETGAALIRVRHPQFEMWSQGMHARSGVACADCHMPPLRRGAASISEHHIASPLASVGKACLRCHAIPESEMNARVAELRARYTDLEFRALGALTGMLDDVYAARERGASEKDLEPARQFQRKAMLRLGFAADGSRGLHAPSESARLLAEAIDFARRGQTAVRSLHGTPRLLGALRN